MQYTVEDKYEVPPPSEEAFLNQLVIEYDKAMQLLLAYSPNSGYTNKYVAESFHSKVRLKSSPLDIYNAAVSRSLTRSGS